jgi:hypothetical protein
VFLLGSYKLPLYFLTSGPGGTLARAGHFNKIYSMKRLLFCLLILALNKNNLVAQSWEVLGERGFFHSVTMENFITFDNYRVPYLFFRDLGNPQRQASVLRYDSEQWVFVGQRGFSEGDLSNPRLVFDSKNRAKRHFLWRLF